VHQAFYFQTEMRASLIMNIDRLRNQFPGLVSGLCNIGYPSLSGHRAIRRAPVSSRFGYLRNRRWLSVVL
jgi:hypothetical protein